MISLLSLFVVSLSLLSTANGINICGTKDPTEDDVNDAREVTKDWNERISQTTIGNQIITIDTVWHRITSGDQGNSENDVTKSMVVLNNAFAPHFKFNLLKNTVSKEPYFWDFPVYGGDGGMRMHLHEGDCSILNIYSTKTSISGYAEFPSSCAYNKRMDGVIISYDTVPGGADPIWNEGYNLVHEVGHWMNLFHTFMGGCSGIGDGIMDTPASRLNRGCPQGKDSCPSEGIDLIHNFMDYTNDSCRTSFTSGQFTMMKAAWYKYRHSGPTRPTTLPTNTPSMTGATNEPTRVYTGKRFVSRSELKDQVMAYCAAPDTYDTSIYGAIEDWDVSQMTSMKELLFDKNHYYYNDEYLDCNPAIGKWDVSRVKNFKHMFFHTTFNQDISAWDVSNGENFIRMFWYSDFNQDINSWDVSKVTDFSELFKYSQFNNDISSWDVSKSVSFLSMFVGSAFNQDISRWNVSKGADFKYMFADSPFDQDISGWDVSGCTEFRGMFWNSLFNQDIGGWDVSTGLYFNAMFQQSHFNQDISRWNVANAKSFNNMFEKSKSFNQNISSWNLSGATGFISMFAEAKAFNQNLDSWLKWVHKDSSASTNWCDGAICDANTALFPTTTPSALPSSNVSHSPTMNRCTGLNKDSCLNKDDVCKYSNQKKILGDCQYMKKAYKHDCAQYISNESCLSGFYGVCKWHGNVCSHVCDDLSKETCKKEKHAVFNIKLCTMPKVKNPCLGCHPNSEC